MPRDDAQHDRNKELAALDIEEYDALLQERDEYIAVLENFIRATLWLQNFYDNNKRHINSQRKEEHWRVTRLRKAASRMPLELYDEVDAENFILNELTDSKYDYTDTDAAWKLLRDRGLAKKPNMSLPSLIPSRQTPYMKVVLDNYKEDEEE